MDKIKNAEAEGAIGAIVYEAAMSNEDPKAVFIEPFSRQCFKITSHLCVLFLSR